MSEISRELIFANRSKRTLRFKSRNCQKRDHSKKWHISRAFNFKNSISHKLNIQKYLSFPLDIRNELHYEHMVEWPPSKTQQPNIHVLRSSRKTHLVSRVDDNEFRQQQKSRPWCRNEDSSKWRCACQPEVRYFNQFPYLRSL